MSELQIPKGAILEWIGVLIPPEEAEKRGYYIFTKEEALTMYAPRENEAPDITVSRMLILADRLQIVMKK